MQTKMLIGGAQEAGTETEEQVLNPRTGEVIVKGGVTIEEPSEELAASLREFIDTQVDGLAVETGEKLGAVDPEGLITRFKETYAKWEGLMADIPADDLDAMAELFKTEVYDKLDVTSYGL